MLRLDVERSGRHDLRHSTSRLRRARRLERVESRAFVPKSYGVGYEGPDYSDLHALYAADWSVNSARSNLFFDNCAGSGCTSPAHSEAESTTAKDSQRFQPPADKRGDLARAMFYMAVRYDGQEADTTDLELSDTPNAAQSLMGMRSTLLQWHLDDPVSAAEMTRNNLICTNYQGNRNPFVDHPQWASCAILGDCKAPAMPPSPPIAPSPPLIPTTGCLLITGIIDGPRSGGTPKAIELHAACGVADLSAYGLGRATNGQGSSGSPSYTLPSGSLAAGSCVYVASESTEFANYFGSSLSVSTSSVMLVNGDDAIELYFNGALIDVFGDVNVDGTGQVGSTWTDGPLG